MTRCRKRAICFLVISLSALFLLTGCGSSAPSVVPTLRPHQLSTPTLLPTASPIVVTTVTSTPTRLPTATPLPSPTHTFTADARTNQIATLRDGASGNHLRVATVPEGTELSVQGRQETWLLVSVNRTVSGWVQQSWVELNPLLDMTAVPELLSPLPLPEILLQYEAVTSRPTDIFSGPSIDYPLIAREIPPYSHMRLSGRDPLGMWLSVRDRFGEVGWVLASSLKFAPDFRIADLPVTVEDEDEENPLKAVYDWDSHRFEWGAQSHDMRHSAEMGQLGMQWIKVQAKWHTNSAPQDVVALIEQAHTRGFKILLAIPGQPYPDSIDYEAYVTHVAGIAALADPPDAIEIWNEMNIDFEWPIGEIDPQLYVDSLLKPAYTAIKTANPAIMVISGAPAPTGFDDGVHAWADDRYIAGMVAAGALDYLDCVGVHYNAGATSPYALAGHPAGDFYGWYFPHVLHAYFRTFKNKPLCITEIGYLTDGDLEGVTMPQNFWWAAGTSVDEHAQWLAEAAVFAHDSGVVRLFVVFNADIYHWDKRDPQTGYAMFRPRGNCPACEAFAQIDLR